MTAYIITFIVGMLLGAGTVLTHQNLVKRAVAKEQNRARRSYNAMAEENDALRGQINELLRCQDSRDSYRQGVEDGKRKGQNMSHLEVLQGTLEGNGRRSLKVGS